MIPYVIFLYISQLPRGKIVRVDKGIQEWYSNMCEQSIRAGPKMVVKIGGQNMTLS